MDLGVIPPLFLERWDLQSRGGRNLGTKEACPRLPSEDGEAGWEFQDRDVASTIGPYSVAVHLAKASLSPLVKQ